MGDYYKDDKRNRGTQEDLLNNIVGAVKSISDDEGLEARVDAANDSNKEVAKNLQTLIKYKYIAYATLAHPCYGKQLQDKFENVDRDIYEMITDGIVGFKCRTKDNYLYRKRKIILQTSYIGNRLSKTKTKTKFFDELTSELQNIKSGENIGPRNEEKHNIGRRS